MDRNLIIETVMKTLLPHAGARALWLEGADATESTDDFSDIDFCCATVPAAMPTMVQVARDALSTLGVLDVDVSTASAGNRCQQVFHLKESAPTLLIDFDVVVDTGSTFLKDDTIERPKILFDKDGVVQFEEPRPPNLADVLDNVETDLVRHVNVEKYLARNEFIEALAYYQRYVLQPLIVLLRLEHTPRHLDYHIVHVSRHLPPADAARLTRLYQVASAADMRAGLADALTWIETLAADVRKRLAQTSHLTP